jgi:DNA-directed RNA polymerase subunit omega
MRAKFKYSIKMIFPIEELVEFTGNVYEITCASIRRAYQLSMVRDDSIEENDGKVVSLAARQVFTNAVEYQIEK